MQLFTRLAILTAVSLTLASPNGAPDTSKRFTTSMDAPSDAGLEKRFPGCIDQNGNDAPCTCSVCSRYLIPHTPTPLHCVCYSSTTPSAPPAGNPFSQALSSKARMPTASKVHTSMDQWAAQPRRRTMARLSVQPRDVTGSRLRVGARLVASVAPRIARSCV